MKFYHFILFLTFGLIILITCGFILMFDFKGPVTKPILLEASLKDGQFIYDLSFYSDSTCVHEITGMGFFQEKFHGSYVLKDANTIQFTKIPYDRKGFIPDELYIDRERGYLLKNPNQEQIDKEFLFSTHKIKI